MCAGMRCRWTSSSNRARARSKKHDGVATDDAKLEVQWTRRAPGGRRVLWSCTRSRTLEYLLYGTAADSTLTIETSCVNTCASLSLPSLSLVVVPHSPAPVHPNPFPHVPFRFPSASPRPMRLCHAQKAGAPGGGTTTMSLSFSRSRSSGRHMGMCTPEALASPRGSADRSWRRGRRA